MKAIPLVLAGVSAALLTQLTNPPVPAYACGGLFCSTRPVVQTKERIVFELEGLKVRAWIQLQIQGNDPSFAWIIPVSSVPEIEVGLDQSMFDALEAQTAPIFIYPKNQPYNSAQSAVPTSVASCGGGSFGAAPTPRQPVEPTIAAKVLPVPKVNVWATAEVGPYEAVTLSADSAMDAVLWLDVHGYRVPGGAFEIIQGYLDEGLKLVAIRLQQNAGSNAVKPIKLTYMDGKGCARIPIKLTAIATIPNLEILAWVFAPARVQSTDYAAIQVDEKTLSGAAAYMPALRGAAQAAGGHGFRTEYASPTSQIKADGNPELADLIARHTWITRVHTTMSASDMTLDPEFLPVTGAKGTESVSNEIYIGGKPTLAVGTGTMIALLGLGLHLRRRRR